MAFMQQPVKSSVGRFLFIAAVLVLTASQRVDAQGSVTDGQLLYNDNCASCHGAPRNSSAANANTVAKLNAAMNSINSMQFLRTLLSVDDVCNIVTYIASQVGSAAPNCSTGVTRNNLILRSSSTTDPALNVGKFTNNVIQFSTLTDPGSAYRLLAAADFNRSGTPDLAFQNITQGEFGDVNSWNEFNSGNPFFWRQVKQVWDIQAVGDLDGDGVDDLVWRYMAPDPRDTGVSFIWFMSGTFPGSQLNPVVSLPRKRGGAPLDWQLLGAVDLNNDGAADMLYLSPAGQFRALMATPARTCANLASGNIPTGFTPVKFAKFRGGVSGEVLVRNTTTGDNQLLSLNASSLVLPAFTGNPADPLVACTSTSLTVPMTTVTLPNADPTWTFFAAADLNNDGTVDIVWMRPNRQLTVWLLNSAGGLLPTLANAGTAPTGFTPLQNIRSK